VRVSLEFLIRNLQPGTPPSSLDAPTAPDGFRHRWIRTETLGMDDTKNMSGKLRSGWELVRAEPIPRASLSTSC
jgi:hypothetical protein